MLRVCLLSCVALTALSAVDRTLAADLSRAMPVKAPAIAPAPIYDWSGIYVGGHVGGALDHRDVAVYSTVTGALLTTGSGDIGSAAGGGQIGFNYVVAPNWVVGIEADVSATDLGGQTPITTYATGSDQHSNKLDLFGTARGRVGYAWNNVMLYGTGGFAWANEKISRTQLTGTLAASTTGTVESATHTATGWAAGGGIAWGFAGNWIARLEYLHLDVGTESFVFPLARQRNDAAVTIDTVRVGLDYKFGWGAPMAAR
jgi:outer membrane immunogenic protein